MFISCAFDVFDEQLADEDMIVVEITLFTMSVAENVLDVALPILYITHRYIF
jgi:hypothetical protein